MLAACAARGYVSDPLPVAAVGRGSLQQFAAKVLESEPVLPARCDQRGSDPPFACPPGERARRQSQRAGGLAGAEKSIFGHESDSTVDDVAWSAHLTPMADMALMAYLAYSAVVNDDRWHSVVLQLSRMDELTGRLLAAHQPDGDGRCRGCTTPGRGTPQARWPCGLYRLANEARSATADGSA